MNAQELFTRFAWTQKISNMRSTYEKALGYNTETSSIEWLLIERFLGHHVYYFKEGRYEAISRRLMGHAFDTGHWVDFILQD